MTKRYYSLRFERNDTLHHAGEQVLNSDSPLRIGQTETCDIKLNNPSQFEDALIAVIEKRENNQGWNLIRISPFKEHEVRVNGTPINYVHHLDDGDRISFEGQRQELTFNIREDALYNAPGLVMLGRKNNRPLIAWMALLSLTIIGFVLYQLYHRPMSQDMIDSAKQSVFQIRVDSIQLLVFQGDSSYIKKTARIDIDFEKENGTAFLTTDSDLVTARHCIQPWLNLPNETVMDTANYDTPLPIRMALEATTRNIIAESMGDDSTWWQMVSYCSLRKPEFSDSIVLSVNSNDFFFNDSRDHIIEYGDFEHQYFWRSLKVRPRRTNMMLGDIAYLPDSISHFGRKGNITMATKEEMQKLCQRANRPLIILGRTTHEVTNGSIKIELEEKQALLQMALTQNNFEDGYPNVVIAHDGTIGPGFSGGPVLTRHGLNGWRVIGVVSVMDKSSKDWYYSVPISEIERMKNAN